MPNQYTRRTQGKYASIESRKLFSVLAEMPPDWRQPVTDLLINYDWPNAGEHQEWLNTETVAKIAEWGTSTFTAQNLEEPANA